MIRIVTVLGCAACAGIALGKTVQEGMTGSTATLSIARSLSETKNGKEMCTNSTALQTNPCVHLDGDGTRHALAPNPCWHYAGRCTSAGSPQCITAPATQSPDATVVTQC